MPRLTANPNAEASASFDVVRPGTYLLRVETISEFIAKSGSTCWKLRASYANTNECVDMAGVQCKNPGALFDNGLVIIPAEKQGKTRSFVEACGKEWTDLDSDELIGLEFQAKVGVRKDKNGENQNEISRYLARVA